MLAIAIISVSVVSVGHAEPVFPPGAQWGIETPRGFVPGNGAVAFTHPSGAMVMIVSSAKPHDLSRMPPVGSAAGTGDRAERYENATVGSAAAKLMVASTVNGRMRILQLMTQGESAGILLALVPLRPSPPVDMGGGRTALLTARERRPDARQQLDALPVRVADTDGMRIAGTVANLGVTLTDGPQPSTSTGRAGASSRWWRRRWRTETASCRATTGSFWPTRSPATLWG